MTRCGSQWKTVRTSAAVAALCSLLLAGCTGRQEEGSSESVPEMQSSNEQVSALSGTSPNAPAPEPMRHDFVILKELARQHALQTEAGNGERLAAVERHLRERIAIMPDEGNSDAEREAFRQARELVK